MRQIEFHTDPRTGEAMYKIAGENVCRELTQEDTEIIGDILADSEAFYPDQFSAVNKEYAISSANRRYYDFLRARRIINCCFGMNDRQSDIDEWGGYHFEQVQCPRIAECKGYKIICNPTFRTSLTERETEVMQLYFNGVATESIAERLFISIHTVNNHRKHALRRLKLHSIAEFIEYAHRNKIFETI